MEPHCRKGDTRFAIEAETPGKLALSIHVLSPMTPVCVEPALASGFHIAALIVLVTSNKDQLLTR